MKTSIQNGDAITVTAATGGVASGDGVIVSGLPGVATFTAAEGEPLELATIGVCKLPPVTAVAFAVGAQVAWDDTAK